MQMLSRKVTYSIIILNELGAMAQNKWRRHSLDLVVAEHLLEGDKMLTRQIVQQLQGAGYIDLIHGNKTLVLNADLKQLTVFDLLKVFHGGIPVGEEHERDYHNLDYYADPKYPEIVLLEMDLKAEAIAFFKRFTIASLDARNKQK